MSDLVELVRQQQQSDEELRKFDPHLLVYGQKLAPTVFDMLYSKIDHDLLFTTEADLVMPEIRQISREVVLNFLGSIPLSEDDTTVEKMVDILAREVWRHICQHRPTID